MSVRRIVELGDLAPPGYAWPTQQGYWQKFVQALGAVAPAATASPGTVNDVLTPPMRTHVGGLIVTAETLTGKSLGQLTSLANNIAALTVETDPVSTLIAVDAFLRSTVQLVLQAATEAGVKAASNVLQVMPIVGQIVNAVVGGYFLGKQYAAAIQAGIEACEQSLHAEANAACQVGWTNGMPTPTRPGSPTPCDLFRPVRVMMTDPTLSWIPPGGVPGRPLPLTHASVYVALCGDLVAPFSQFVWNKVGKKGIDLPTRQKMWSICKALMEGAEPPGFAYTPMPLTAIDGGRALFAVLQDIVWREITVERSITEAHVLDVCKFIGQQYRYKKSCDVGSSGGGKVYFETSCGERTTTPLFNAWRDSLLQYDALLRVEFKDPVTGAWKATPTTKIPMRATASMTLSPGAANILSKVAQTPILQKGFLRRVTPRERAVAGASVATITGAAAAALAFLL